MTKAFSYSLPITLAALVIGVLLFIYNSNRSSDIYQHYDETSEFITALKKFDYGKLEKEFGKYQELKSISTSKSQLILAYHHTRLGEMERAALHFQKIKTQPKKREELTRGKYKNTYELMYNFVNIQQALWSGNSLPTNIKDVATYATDTKVGAKLKCLINVSTKLNRNTSKKLISSKNLQNIEQCDQVPDGRLNQLLHYSNYISDNWFSLSKDGVEPALHRILAIEIFKELESNFTSDKYNKILGYKALFEEARMLRENDLSLYALLKLRSVFEIQDLFNKSRSIEHAIDFSGSFTWHMTALRKAHIYISENIEFINSQSYLNKALKVLPLYEPYYLEYSKKIEKKLAPKVSKANLEDFFLNKELYLQSLHSLMHAYAFHNPNLTTSLGDKFIKTNKDKTNWRIFKTNGDAYLFGKNDIKKGLQFYSLALKFLPKQETYDVRELGLLEGFIRAAHANDKVDLAAAAAERMAFMFQELINKNENNFISRYTEEGMGDRLEAAFTALNHQYLNLIGEDDFDKAFYFQDVAFKTLQLARYNPITKPFASSETLGIGRSASKLKTNFFRKSLLISLLKNYSFREGEIISDALISLQEETKKVILLLETNDINKNSPYYPISVFKIIDNIPSDTIVLIANDANNFIHFSLVNQLHFSISKVFIEKKQFSSLRDKILDSIENTAVTGAYQKFAYDEAAQLYNMIFKSKDYDFQESIEEIIEKENIKNLIFLPSKSLDYLPLQMLIAEKSSSKNKKAEKWLIDKVRISYYPDFNEKMLSQIFSKEFSKTAKEEPVSSVKSFLGIANPKNNAIELTEFRGLSFDDNKSFISKFENLSELPETVIEIEGASNALNPVSSTILSGDSATEEKVIQELKKKHEVIMFSTHGIIANSLFPGSEAALMLSGAKKSSLNDGFLTSSEILDFDLSNAQMIILNACNTARGSDTNAPGLTGLAQAFFNSGAKSLMVTNWAIPTVSTVKLTEFMFEYLKSNKDASYSSALHQAQLKLKNIEEYSHPLYWAPFTIYGNF